MIIYYIIEHNPFTLILNVSPPPKNYYLAVVFILRIYVYSPEKLAPNTTLKEPESNRINTAISTSIKFPFQAVKHCIRSFPLILN